ncbi:MAG: ABC transporter ATP-binding protein [Verrucomicrobiae bacterium]|jgi:ABC-2 type transport system ATP-binding protein|nr:ABC transporter ATP-binding protein [Verrucomicrobiae bacterium]
MKSSCAVSIEHVTKKFYSSFLKKPSSVLTDFSWNIEKGQVAALLGPNGSGKSTLLKILLGFLNPTKGRAQLFGIPCWNLISRHSVGFLPENPVFPSFFNAREALTFYGKLSNVPSLSSKIEELLVLVALHEKADDLIGNYSQGMRQRLGLAQALIHDPKLLILDEPTTGLDPVGLDFLSDLLLELKKLGKTILLTSHLLAHVEKTCDQIAIIKEGRLLHTRALDKMKQEHSPSSLEQLYLNLVSH